MLQNLREHVHGWIAGVIAVILCLAFALFGIQYYISGSHDQAAMVKVNGQEITQAQLDTLYKRLRQAANKPGIVFNETMQKDLKSKALQGLIQAEVLAQAAGKAGYIISPVQISLLIMHNPGFQVSGQFSPELFQRILYHLDYTPDKFAAEIAKAAVIQQVQMSYSLSEFALQSDVDRGIQLGDQRRDFGYLLIPTARFANSAEPSEQEIAQYYHANAQKFTSPEQVSLQYIILSSDDIAKKVTVTESELQQYYEENKAAFASPQQAKNPQVTPFSVVKTQVEKNLRQQKVDKLVSQQSDQLSNATYTHPETLKPAADALGLPIQTTEYFGHDGGKTGIIANPKIFTAAFSDNVLKQHNNSDVISLNDRTVAVIRIADYKPSAVRPLAEVKPMIVVLLRQQAMTKAAQILGEKLTADLQKGSSPQQIAKDNQLVWTTKVNVLNRSQDVPSGVLSLAFNQPVPVAGKPAIRGSSLPDGNYAIVILNKVTPGVIAAVDANQRLAMQKQMAQGFGAFDYALYATEQMAKAKIKKEQDIQVDKEPY